MSERDSPSSRKWLLGGLLVIWALVSFYAIWSLEREGAAVCESLVESVEKYPGSQRPCEVARYDEEGEHLSSRRYHFEQGRLERVTFDRDTDGTYEAGVNCTLFGRVMMPLTNTQNWLSVVVSNAAKSRSERVDYVEKRSEDDGEQRVVYFETTREENGETLRREDRRDAADQLIERRFFTEYWEGPVRELQLEYDSDGRLVSVRRRSALPEHVSHTRLGYESCAESLD